MQVNAVSQASHAHAPSMRAAEKTPRAAESDSQTTAPAGASGDGVKGVIRLLQEGHFKGVADVRLRINFNEELQALQGEADSQQAQAVVQKLLIDVKASLDTFLVKNSLDEDSLEAFSGIRASFELKIEGVIQSETEDDAVEALSAAFEAFLDEVSALLAPPEETEVLPTEELVDTEPVEAQPSLQQLAESLQGILQSAIENLNNPATLLPPLSEPSGNGSAYAKFLAIYQGLNGTETPEAPESAIDVTL